MEKTRRLELAGALLAIAAFLLPEVAGPFAFLPPLLLSLVCFWLAKRIKPDPASAHACPYTVEFDDEEVRVIFKGKLHERLQWSEVRAIGIRIDDSYLPAPWWILFGGPKAGCMYPSEASGWKEMLAEMQRRFPEFDNRAVIEAMGLMEGGRMVWSRQEPTLSSTEPPRA